MHSECGPKGAIMAIKIKLKEVTGRDPHISMPEVGKETRFCLNDWVHTKDPPLCRFVDPHLRMRFSMRVAGSVIEYRFVSGSRSPDVKLLLVF